jgi:phage terminase Nu1 subunit (DNA packaging protein)
MEQPEIPAKRGRGSGNKANTGRKSARDEQAVASAYEVYNKAKAKREVHNANLAELEERKTRGELVAVSEVRQQAVQAARAVREAMLALPSRLSAILADQPEPVVRERMTIEIRKMLEVIADEL